MVRLAVIAWVVLLASLATLGDAWSQPRNAWAAGARPQWLCETVGMLNEPMGFRLGFSYRAMLAGSGQVLSVTTFGLYRLPPLPEIEHPTDQSLAAIYRDASTVPAQPLTEAELSRIIQLLPLMANGRMVRIGQGAGQAFVNFPSRTLRCLLPTRSSSVHRIINLTTELGEGQGAVRTANAAPAAAELIALLTRAFDGQLYRVRTQDEQAEAMRMYRERTPAN